MGGLRVEGQVRDRGHPESGIVFSWHRAQSALNLYWKGCAALGSGDVWRRDSREIEGTDRTKNS